MNPNASAGRERLQAIARRAMTERGLLPDFSPAAPRERVVETGPALRDLRDLAWVSIDNDDTRDLDQLSVAEPLAGGAAVKLLVADTRARTPTRCSRKVRALPAESGGATPAIALTGYANPQDRVDAISAGFQMHVSKPVTPAAVASLVAPARPGLPPR